MSLLTPNKTDSGRDQDLNDLAKAHADTYAKLQRTCLHKLSVVYRDLGIRNEQQLEELQEVQSAALNVWSAAVESAEGRRMEMRQKIGECQKEMSRIKETMDGEGANLQFGLSEDADLVSPRKQLKDLYDEARAELAKWRERKALRVKEYEEVMSEHMSLRQQLGLLPAPSSNTKPDISSTNLEFLQMENDKLRADKGRRLLRLEGALERLRAICVELGEDERAAAADVHLSLRNAAIWQQSGGEESMNALRRLSGIHTTSSGSGMAVPGPDVSDGTFSRVEGKIADMHALKAERIAHASDLAAVLSSLWEALDVPSDSVERSAFSKVLAGPQRLHARSLEKGMAEVARLEGAKAQAMYDIIHAKARELSDACAAAHISAPDVSMLLADAARRKADTSGATGQLAELLSKLVRMLAEINGVIAKRAPVMSLTEELQEARAESDWLREYDNDENRYKGRDANRKLQRAIKSQKQRERMPALLAALRAALAEWQVTEGSAFAYDGRDQLEALEEIEQELEAVLCDKEAARKAGKVKPSAAGVLAGAPPKAVSSLAPAAAGGRTPGGGVRASLAVERSSGHLGAPASVGADRRSSFGNFSAREGGTFGSGGGSAARHAPQSAAASRPAAALAPSRPTASAGIKRTPLTNASPATPSKAAGFSAHRVAAGHAAVVTAGAAHGPAYGLHAEASTAAAPAPSRDAIHDKLMSIMSSTPQSSVAQLRPAGSSMSVSQHAVPSSPESYTTAHTHPSAATPTSAAVMTPQSRAQGVALFGTQHVCDIVGDSVEPVAHAGLAAAVSVSGSDDLDDAVQQHDVQETPKTHGKQSKAVVVADACSVAMAAAGTVGLAPSLPSAVSPVRRMESRIPRPAY